MVKSFFFFFKKRALFAVKKCKKFHFYICMEGLLIIITPLFKLKSSLLSEKEKGIITVVG